MGLMCVEEFLRDEYKWSGLDPCNKIAILAADSICGN